MQGTCLGYRPNMNSAVACQIQNPSRCIFACANFHIGEESALKNPSLVIEQGPRELSKEQF